MPTLPVPHCSFAPVHSLYICVMPCLIDGVRNSGIPLPLTGMASLLQIQGLPTLVFVGTDVTKPAFRTEGLLPAGEILKVLDMVKAG